LASNGGHPRMTQEEKLAIVVEAVLKLYGHIEIRTRRDDELIKLLYEIKRGDEKDEYTAN